MSKQTIKGRAKAWKIIKLHDNRACIERHKSWAFEGAAGERRVAREKIKDRAQLVAHTLRNFVRLKHGIPLLFAAIDRLEAVI